MSKIRRFSKQPAVAQESESSQQGQKVMILRWTTSGPRRVQPAAKEDPSFTLPLERRRSASS